MDMFIILHSQSFNNTEDDATAAISISALILFIG